MRQPNLTARRLRPEMMDDPSLSAEEHRRALGGLRRLHAVSRSVSHLWTPISRLAMQLDAHPLRVVDWASGGGDVLIALAKRARHAGLAFQGEGRDVSERAVQWAQDAAEQQRVHDVVRFRCVDCRDAARADEQTTDIAISSLFLHHLPEDDVCSVLAAMKTSARAVVVQDLVRSPSGWRWAWAGSRLVPTCHVVRTDALLSVANAFTPRELRDLAHRAGLDGARVDVAWPQRMTLTWERSP